MARPQVPEGLRVKYYHERHIIKRGPRKGQLDPKRGSTLALVFTKDELVAVGVSKVWYKDNFNKRLGRDVALGRALKNLKAQIPPDLEPAYQTWAFANEQRLREEHELDKRKEKKKPKSTKSKKQKSHEVVWP